MQVGPGGDLDPQPRRRPHGAPAVSRRIALLGDRAGPGGDRRELLALESSLLTFSCPGSWKVERLQVADLPVSLTLKRVQLFIGI